MNIETLRKLEFEKVRELLSGYCMSYLGREQVAALAPTTDLNLISRAMRETEEARQLIATGSSVPISSLEGIEKITGLLGKGYLLSETDIASVHQFLESTRQLKRYMLAKVDKAPTVTSYAHALDELDPVRRDIERCIAFGRVTDEATPELGRVRKKIAVVQERLKKKIDAIVQKYSSYLQETLVRQRHDRYVIAVKKEFKRLIHGTVVDESASGQTVFMEPLDLFPLQQELAEHQAAEEREVAKVLSYLTGTIEQHQATIETNLEWIGYYDFLFAKAKYANALGGRPVNVNASGVTVLNDARHPLLPATATPLSFAIGEDYRALVITGPNTGGKTVTLKTVGLTTVMVQCGMLVPLAEDSHVAVYEDVLADIGDGQSLEQSLSTFSSHVKNVIEILKTVGPGTLVLLDELATGTDPGEGVGLSIAILEALYERGATIVATTHFNEIKTYAAVTAGFENARMEFDTESMQPLYRLKIGEAGMSYAFLIAQKLGIPPEIVRRARVLTETVEAGRGQVDDFPSAKAATPADTTRESRHTIRTASRAEASERARVERAQPVYRLGDRVWIHPLKKSGIVCDEADDKGNVGVIVQKQRHVFNVRRIAPYLKREELYPEDYDLDIVLQSKAVRKKRKLMNKRHIEGMSIEFPPER